jgi:3D (Asp-Asp-Asp) domain-containing protein
VALADEGVFDSSKAFLTVQPITLEEKDVNEVILQDNLFVATVSSKSSLSVKESAAKAATVAPSKAVIVTAYSSTADQTDSTPFITANGTRVQDGIIACNFLPFGTKVKFPEYSGDKVFTVTDRMAKKNSHKIDIWMPSRSLAMEFGVQKLAYEIVQ